MLNSLVGYRVIGMMTTAPPRVQTPQAPPARPEPAVEPAGKIDVSGLDFYYGQRRVLEQISVRIRPNEVTALIGPSGCGKSTFLRTLNRMNDIVPGSRVEGAVTIDGQDIYASAVDVRRSPAPRRHGLPAVQSVSQIDLRQRRLRPADQPSQPGRARSLAAAWSRA